MNAHAKGLRNQRKSKQYILAHPEIYGVLTAERIHTVQSSSYGGDMFSVKYGYTDRHNPKTGEFEKIPLLAGWDIVTMPSFHSDIQKQFGMDIRPMCLNAAEKLISFNYIFLIQVKTNEMPKTAYIKTLKDFQVPFYVKKELHIWNDRQKEPDIIDL